MSPRLVPPIRPLAHRYLALALRRQVPLRRAPGKLKTVHRKRQVPMRRLIPGADQRSERKRAGHEHSRFHQSECAASEFELRQCAASIVMVDAWRLGVQQIWGYICRPPVSERRLRGLNPQVREAIQVSRRPSVALPAGWRVHTAFSWSVLMIRQLKSGEYRLYSRKKDAKTGRRRNLGTFKTRKAAEAQERAVQYFKRH